MSGLNNSEQLAQTLGRFACHFMNAAGFNIAVGMDAIVKNMGGFYSGSAGFTNAPRYLAFSLNWDDPNQSEEQIEKTGGTIKNNIEAFVNKINRNYGRGKKLIDAEFKEDYDGRLQSIYLKVEPLLQKPAMLVQIVEMLNRRTFIKGGIIAGVGITLYRVSNLIDDKKPEDTQVRKLLGAVGLGTTFMGGYMALQGASFMAPKMAHWQDYVKDIRKNLDDDRGVGQ